MSFTQTESNRKIHKLLVRKDPEISSIMFLSMMKKKRSKKKRRVHSFGDWLCAYYVLRMVR